jgi:5-methylcytosine-specific restriction endonuclease McrA
MTNRYGLDDGCTALPHLDTPGVCNRCGAALTGRRTQWCSDQCETAFRADHDWNAARHAALVRDNRRCVKCGGHGSYRVGTMRFHAGRDGWRFARLGVEWCGPDDVWIDALWHIPWLEVNHITPRNGGGYQWGCHNHQSNLETLCHGCHVAETNRQAAARRGFALQPTLFDEATR